MADMTEPIEPKIVFTDELTTPRPRTPETVAARFPDAGEPPSNEVVVDPDAPPSPNIQHPE